MFKLSKNKAKGILSNVTEDKAFWVNNGRVLRNLKDLSAALADMEDNTFNYHVNKDKNDFRNWILDAIGDVKLAKDTVKTKSKKALLRKLDKRINKLESLIKK